MNDAFAEPQRPVGKGFMGLFALANLGLWMAFFAPIQVLLAQQMALIAPAGKEAALGWVTGVGALVSLVANPLFGALSDRTTSRFGRRRPWTLAGAVLGAGALAMLGRQTTLAGATLWWCVAQLTLNAMLAALSAEVPDQVPVSQRAVCSAWFGVTQPLGVVAGTLLVTALAGGVSAGYAAVASALLLCALPFVLRVGNTPLRREDRPPWRWRAFFAAFWLSPRRFPDFAWAWLTRCLINLGNALATLYLLYFLRDRVRYEALFPGETAEDGLLILVGVYTAGVLLSAFMAGVLSDRSGRRKVPVMAASVVMAAASALLALWPSWPVTIAGAALMGLGYGIYVAVDQALITQVLPAAADRGKDLGLINIANSAPQVLAPAIAALLVTRWGGYPALFLAAAAVTLLSGGLVHRIRGVR
ncbi:MFS transporter [Aquabacterium sp.]|uniref:MFS transporter n=1 Tax=Aquabacterium sp. TaxID=1872578 RepID=UPI00378500F3